jgi:hypothetical protein
MRHYVLGKPDTMWAWDKLIKHIQNLAEQQGEPHPE